MGRKAKSAALKAVPENEESVPEAGASSVDEIMRLIASIDAEVERRVAAITSAAENAIRSLRNDLKTKIVSIPKMVRQMNLKDFQARYPDDFNSGALEEIRQRYAARAAAAEQTMPPLTKGRGVRTGSKRAAPEPATVLHTVKARRTAPTIPSWNQLGQAPQPTATRRSARADPVISGTQQTTTAHDIAAPNDKIYNGLPLQTPLPFAGSAVALPITMLTQKGGGRTKAAAIPDAAIVTTSDGMQWAFGKDGMSAIPDSHRSEVADLLSAQFNFLVAALGRTVFDRPNGRGKRG